MTAKPEQTDKSGDQWISSLIDEARNSHPLIDDRVFVTMEQLLNGQISKRELTPKDLKSVAIQLIGGMTSKPI